MNIKGLNIHDEILRHNQTLKEPAKVGKENFKDLLTGAIEEVNSLQQSSDTQIKDLMTGKSQDLSATVMAVQQADSSFRMMMSVRNKIIEAYKEIQRGGI